MQDQRKDPGSARLILLTMVPIVFLSLLSVDYAAIVWFRNLRDIGVVSPDTGMYLLYHIFDPLIQFITNGGTPIAAAFVLSMLGRYLQRNRFRKLGSSLFWGLISAGIAVHILKHLIGRARPRITYDLAFIGPTWKRGYDSFPSGHTTVVFCLAYILSQYFPKYRLGFYLFAVAGGLGRLVGLSHFPSDVLAGAILGIVVAQLLPNKFLPSALRWKQTIDEKDSSLRAIDTFVGRRQRTNE